MLIFLIPEPSSSPGPCSHGRLLDDGVYPSTPKILRSQRMSKPHDKRQWISIGWSRARAEKNGQRMGPSQTARVSVEKSMQWKFTTPASPHQNGCAEALVKSCNLQYWTKAVETLLEKDLFR